MYYCIPIIKSQDIQNYTIYSIAGFYNNVTILKTI